MIGSKGAFVTRIPPPKKLALLRVSGKVAVPVLLIFALIYLDYQLIGIYGQILPLEFYLINFGMIAFYTFMCVFLFAFLETYVGPIDVYENGIELSSTRFGRLVRLGMFIPKENIEKIIISFGYSLGSSRSKYPGIGIKRKKGIFRYLRRDPESMTNLPGVIESTLHVGVEVID